MAVTPPLDKITTLPAFGVDTIQEQINRLIDLILAEMKLVIQEVIKLPNGIDCNDPRVQQIKDLLQSIQDKLQQVKEQLPKIQQIISQVQTVIKTGLTIKNAIAAAQLLNPITAPLFIASLTQQLQDELVSNAIQAIQPLQAVPNQAVSKLNTLIPPLTNAISSLNSACNEDIGLDIPTLDDDNFNNFGEDFDYNDLLPSEFYREINVSETDLDQRSDTIQQLVEQQQNLLTSLIEAPSQVYREPGVPSSNLGKTGDFYVDTENNIAYGPKPSDTEWGGPLN
mgnify:CR=1 FL=1|tara:strand:- start:18856 stop:19701 length:846 start_codon:yes stop_codon:yes gene_type:complete